MNPPEPATPAPGPFPTRAEPSPHPLEAIVGRWGEATYGASLVPWDDRIRLEPTPNRDPSTRGVTGIISVGGRTIPVLDLRPAKESPAPPNSPRASAYLFVVAILHPSAGHIEVGCLVSAADGKIVPPTQAIWNQMHEN